MITIGERRKEARKLLKLPECKFEAVDLLTAKFVPKGLTRAFRNNRYTIMVYDNTPTTKGLATKVLIQNHLDKPIIFHWDWVCRMVI